MIRQEMGGDDRAEREGSEGRGTDQRPALGGHLLRDSEDRKERQRRQEDRKQISSKLRAADPEASQRKEQRR